MTQTPSSTRGSMLRGALNAGLAAGIGMAAVVPAITHDAPAMRLGTPQQIQQMDASKPSNTPTWNKHLSQQFKGFNDIDSKPESAIPSRVVAVQQNGQPTKMGFQKAWDRGQDKDPTNDVWTVGYR